MSEDEIFIGDPGKQDPWSVWFFRFIQVVGAALLIRELWLLEDPRIVALGVELGLISGALGIERLIQWFVRR